MAFYRLTPDEMNLVLQFVNDENKDVLKTDIPQRFVNISAAFSSKLFKAYGLERGKAARLERVNTRVNARLEKQFADGNFAQLRMNVLDIALCIVYLLKEGDFYYSRNRIQYILYEAYCSWLVSKKERLFDAHPVAQEWGPHFWEISKRVGNIQPVTSIENFKVVAEKDAGVAEFLRNVVKKYGGWTEEALKTLHTDTVAYKNAMPKKRGEALTPNESKWGHIIKDADIYNWSR